MKIGINGLGRIGRLCLRACIEKYIKKHSDIISICALNTTAKPKDLAYLLQYDSTHGIAPFDVGYGDNFININELKIPIFNFPDAKDIPWHDLEIQTVLECSGRLTSRDLASMHNAAKVIVSSPCKGADATVVLGANEEILRPAMKVISIGSCTTNALAPIAKILHDNFIIESGYATTVHAYTFDQNLLDNFHEDPRRSRSATASMIPTKSGISSALALVLPELAGKITGSAIRVPTANVSLIDFSFTTRCNITAEQINTSMLEASKGNMSNILAIAQDRLVSIDFNHNQFSTVFDPFETVVVGNNFARILSWYDNEWGFANRMLDVAQLLFKHDATNN